MYRRKGAESAGDWIQFECVVCMLLEAKWQSWNKDKNIALKILIEDEIAEVNFEEMVAVVNKKE